MQYAAVGIQASHLFMNTNEESTSHNVPEMMHSKISWLLCCHQPNQNHAIQRIITHDNRIGRRNSVLTVDNGNSTKLMEIGRRKSVHIVWKNWHLDKRSPRTITSKKFKVVFLMHRRKFNIKNLPPTDTRHRDFEKRTECNN